jgi:hypothetical protein
MQDEPRRHEGHEGEEPKVMSDWKARVEALGKAGIVVYLTVQVLTIAGFYVALCSPEVRGQPWFVEHLGADSVIGTGSLLFSAWLLSKALMVPRAALTCLITPFVVKPLELAWLKVRR